MRIEKKVFRSGPYADLFCQGVRVGETIYLAGQVGTDENGAAPEDLVAQMKHAYAHVQSVLAEYGATMDNVVDETWFVTDIDDTMAKVGDLFEPGTSCAKSGTSNKSGVSPFGSSLACV